MNTNTKNSLNKIALFFFFLFIIFNGLKIAIITQLLTSLPLDYIVGKIASEISICGIFILILFLFKRPIYLIIFYILQSIFLFSNMAYFFYFHSYLHLFSWFSLLKETTSVIRHFAIPLEWEMLLILMDIPAFILALIYYKKINQDLLNIKTKRKSNRKISLAFLILIIFIFIYVGQFIIYYKDSTPYELINTNKFKGEATFIYFYGFTANSIAVFNRDKFNKNKEDLLNFGPLISLDNKSKIDGKNKIFIFQIEALESSIVNTKYENKYIMPFLNGLTKSSIYFPFCLSYHKGGNTSDAEFSIINSVEPLNDYPAIKLGQEAYENSFIKKLKNLCSTFHHLKRSNPTY